LAQAVYDTKDLPEKRKATAELFEWLDTRPEIQRQFYALNLATWTLPNKGLGVFSFEFAEQIVPRLPQQYGSRGQKAFQQQIDSSRRRYEEYLRQEEQKKKDAATPDP